MDDTSGRRRSQVYHDLSQLRLQVGRVTNYFELYICIFFLFILDQLLVSVSMVAVVIFQHRPH